MKLDDFKRMQPVGDRKVQDESNLRDMSEVRVRTYERGGARYELDEKNARFRKLDPSTSDLGPWEALEK